MPAAEARPPPVAKPRHSASAPVGDPTSKPKSVTYKLPRLASQLDHVEGAPIGTRGGVSVIHTFPADGEYVFAVSLHALNNGAREQGPYRSGNEKGDAKKTILQIHAAKREKVALRN